MQHAGNGDWTRISEHGEQHVRKTEHLFIHVYSCNGNGGVEVLTSVNIGIRIKLLSFTDLTREVRVYYRGQ